MMNECKNNIRMHIEELEKTIIDFEIDEKKGFESLRTAKESLTNSQKNLTDENGLFLPCIYNVLATINSVPVTNKKTRQLIEALLEAKEEMSVIMELL